MTTPTPPAAQPRNVSFARRFGSALRNRFVAIPLAAVAIFFAGAFIGGDWVRTAPPGMVLESAHDIEVNGLEHRLEQLTEKLNAAEEARNTAQQGQAKLQLELRELRPLRDKVTELERQMSERTADLERRLAEKTSELETARSNFSPDGVTALATQVAEMKEQVSELAGKASAIPPAIARLNQQVGPLVAAGFGRSLLSQFQELEQAAQPAPQLVLDLRDWQGKLAIRASLLQSIASSSSAGHGFDDKAVMDDLEGARRAIASARPTISELTSRIEAFDAAIGPLVEEWKAANAAATLSGPTAEEVAAAEAMKARRSAWATNLKAALAAPNTVKLPAGTTVEELVARPDFAAYIDAYLAARDDTAFRGIYLDHGTGATWTAGSKDVQDFNNPAHKPATGQHTMTTGPFGVTVCGFGQQDFFRRFAASGQWSSQVNAIGQGNIDWAAETSWFNTNFLAMLTADAGPNGEPSLRLR
ncbi:MAG: hypothetical protein KDD44_04055 [Bdellovibrionales bacterium]|nr:hypothetical protein [Bdellovibrionales bacterium]